MSICSFAQVDVVWTDLVGTSTTGNTITKIAGGGWSNGGAVSTQILSPNSSGWIETTVQETNKNKVFGFSKSNVDNHYRTIDYGFQTLTNGTLRIRELGKSKGDVGNITIGDVLRIERNGTTINYLHNCNIVYTSLTPSSSQLIMDASIYTSGGIIANAVFSSTNIQCDGGDGGDGLWTENTSHINYAGKVLIGPNSTNVPIGYNLYVTNGILAEKVKVALSNSNSWADFVFAPNYHLLSIEEVEKYIKQNRHLPNVPSALDLKKDGFDIAKMDAILLRQIEELWLHLIEIKKENIVLKEKLNLSEDK